MNTIDSLYYSDEFVNLAADCAVAVLSATGTNMVGYTSDAILLTIEYHNGLIEPTHSTDWTACANSALAYTPFYNAKNIDIVAGYAQKAIMLLK